MSSLLSADELAAKEGFWQRQFSLPPTPFQTIFDVAFGVLMPIVCFYLDPGIIRGDFYAPLASVSLFIYGFSLVAILTLAIWLGAGHRAGASAAAFGGIMLSGALCSFIIGMLILPLTIIGILLGVGLLGFVPFITAFVYLRNAVRAITRGNSLGNRSRLIAGVIVSALFVIGTPAFAQWEVCRLVAQSMDEILGGDPGQAGAAVQRIKYLRAAGDTDKMVHRYEQETDKERKERLARAYKEITGEDIEARLARLND